MTDRPSLARCCLEARGSSERGFRAAIWAGAWLTLQATAAFAQQAPPGSYPYREMVEHRVLPGDTCQGIAEMLYGDRRYYYIILEHNPGAPDILPRTCNRTLVPGQMLRLPRRAPPAPDAQVTAVKRRVRSRPPVSESWTKAHPGQKLYRGWRVNTKQRSTAELTFRDQSKIHVRANTLIIVYGSAPRSTRRQTSRATLEKGTLRARLSELAGRHRLELDTPSARAQLSGGEAVVDVDDRQVSRVANHRGPPASVSSRDGRAEVMVPAGMGTRVQPGRPPSRPQPLPAAPFWVPDQRQMVEVPPGQSRPISARWNKVEGAQRYRVEITTAGNDAEQIEAHEVPSQITSFELRGLQAGTYEATVAAIDADGLEGPRSLPFEIALKQLRLDPPRGGHLETGSSATHRGWPAESEGTTGSHSLGRANPDHRWSPVAEANELGIQHDGPQTSGLAVALAYYPDHDRSRGGDPFLASLWVRLGLLEDRLGLVVGIPVGLEQTEGGLRVGSLYRLTSPGHPWLEVSTSLEAWLPFEPSSSGAYGARFMHALGFTVRLRSGFALRTRQAGVVETAPGGAHFWASAYALDLRVAGPLSVSSQLAMLVGLEHESPVTASAASVGARLSWRSWGVSGAIRFALTGDAARLWGRSRAVISVWVGR